MTSLTLDSKHGHFGATKLHGAAVTVTQLYICSISVAKIFTDGVTGVKKEENLVL